VPGARPQQRDHHAEDGYPYQWVTGWGGPCRSATPLLDDIERLLFDLREREIETEIEREEKE